MAARSRRPPRGQGDTRRLWRCSRLPHRPGSRHGPAGGGTRRHRAGVRFKRQSRRSSMWQVRQRSVAGIVRFRTPQGLPAVPGRYRGEGRLSHPSGSVHTKSLTRRAWLPHSWQRNACARSDSRYAAQHALQAVVEAQEWTTTASTAGRPHAASSPRNSCIAQARCSAASSVGRSSVAVTPSLA